VLAPWIEQLVTWFCGLGWTPGSYPSLTFYVYPALAIVLVSLVCGSVGSIVVGNRMAFFSDALAHCAFAGVALGVLLALTAGFEFKDMRHEDAQHFVTRVMVAFGVLIGLAIAFVREKTALSNDTVIGVFFAGAMGLGAMLLTAVARKGFFNLEGFLFGSPDTAEAVDIEYLVWMVVATALFLVFFYNDMVFASFSPTLASSRRVPARLCQYLFIALLGVIVNLSIRIVGVLLINAMLIVPAATAANVCGNMRRFYRWSVILAVCIGFFGYWLSLDLRIPDSSSPDPLRFGTSGVIVVLGVLLFFGSMVLKPVMRRRGAVNPVLQNMPAEPRITPSLPSPGSELREPPTMPST
jgi:zinc transport system permease protein